MSAIVAAQTSESKHQRLVKENWPFPFSQEDWANTPASVQKFLLYLVSSHAALEKRIEEKVTFNEF
jgi:hypothetical protein